MGLDRPAECGNRGFPELGFVAAPWNAKKPKCVRSVHLDEAARVFERSLRGGVEGFVEANVYLVN